MLRNKTSMMATRPGPRCERCAGEPKRNGRRQPAGGNRRVHVLGCPLWFAIAALFGSLLFKTPGQTSAGGDFRLRVEENGLFPPSSEGEGVFLRSDPTTAKGLALLTGGDFSLNGRVAVANYMSTEQRPRLSISAHAGRIRLFWSETGSGPQQLEYSDDIGGRVWNSVEITPELAWPFRIVTVEAAGETRFFRLRRLRT